MPEGRLWGWDDTNKVWIPLQVDENGYVKVDMSNINLNDLADVSVAAPADDDLFYYDDATSLWKSRKLVDADIPAAIARDTEVISAISTHAALPSVHHTKYTDAEAEAVADTQIGTHAALPTVHQDAPALIATHAALTTGVHGAGSHTLLHSGAAVQGLAKAYLGANQEVVIGRNCTLQLDTVVFDLDSCWQTGDWYGASGAYRQADADSDATHIEDDDANFPVAVLGSKVYTASNAAGTLNTGIYYVSQNPAPTSTTLKVQKLSGADFAGSYYYWFQKRHYVAPVTGYYPCFFQEQYLSGVEADKRYGIYIYVNGVYTIASLFHTSHAAMVRLPHNGVLALTAGDIVSMHTFSDSVGNPTMGNGIGNTVMTIYCLQEAA